MTIEITNLTPFANMRFSNLDKHGLEFGVFMVKGTWDIPQDRECVLSEEQEPFVFTDEYHGELNFSALRYPSDFVPYKPVTDIILDATAYAPDGIPSREWTVGVRIFDAKGLVCMKALKITGPRSWIPKWKRALSDEEKSNWKDYRDLFDGWELSEPEPITKLPIRYEYAYGGLFLKGTKEDGSDDYEVFDQNLVGRGWIHPELTDHTQPVPAPQIEDLDDPIVDPYRHYKPQGFGPVPPSWQPRLALGGTYDQNWLENIHPNWPPDYDFGFHNSASDGLKAARHVEGDLVFELVGLHPEQRKWVFKLPDPGTHVLLDHDENDFATNTSRRVRAALDTVFLEISEKDHDDPRIYCNWRVMFNLDEVNLIYLAALSFEDRAEVEAGDLVLALPPNPKAVSVTPTYDRIAVEEVT